jgi:hypothetical protein
MLSFMPMVQGWAPKILARNSGATLEKDFPAESGQLLTFDVRAVPEEM